MSFRKSQNSFQESKKKVKILHKEVRNVKLSQKVQVKQVTQIFIQSQKPNHVNNKSHKSMCRIYENLVETAKSNKPS